MARRPLSIATQLIHTGQPHPRYAGAVVHPIFQSANFEQPQRPGDGVTYARLSNTPNHTVLAARLAAIESAEAALVTASGMAAITAALLAVCSQGDHLLVQDNVYGGTQHFLSTDARRFGLSHTGIDGQRPDSWAAALRPSTRAIYVESISNPLMQVTDLVAVVRFAREHGLTTLIDNTFLSPVLFRPAELGFDLVLHSASKYLNGHSDVIAGVLAGRADLVSRASGVLLSLGGSLDPHACFLLERGLKTLALRVPHQSRSALQIATALSSHPVVSDVRYPGLPGHPQHQRAAALFDGCGGMLAFRLSSGEHAARFLGAVELATHASSLGAVESLVVTPAHSTHINMPPAARRALGITEDLIRLSVGIEDPADLIADLERALRVAAHPADLQHR
jgi:cystathionine beta-lyase/cystathionine gamma-synthase